MSTPCCALIIHLLKLKRTRPTRVERWSAFSPPDSSDFKPTDRSYVAKVVSARTGLSQAEAEKRVNDVVSQVKTDLDEARKVTMKIAIWLTLSLFISAFSASLAATEGGGLRDGTWGKKIYGYPATSR
jgi:hypothetical protein